MQLLLHVVDNNHENYIIIRNGAAAANAAVTNVSCKLRQFTLLHNLHFGYILCTQNIDNLIGFFISLYSLCKRK